MFTAKQAAKASKQEGCQGGREKRKQASKQAGQLHYGCLTSTGEKGSRLWKRTQAPEEAGAWVDCEKDGELGVGPSLPSPPPPQVVLTTMLLHSNTDTKYIIGIR